MGDHHSLKRFVPTIGRTSAKGRSALDFIKCYRCRELKPKNAYGPSLANSFGLTSWCRECLAAYNRERNRAIKRGTWDRSHRTRHNNAETPRPAVIPTIVDVAWAAGFLEGEGTFTKTQGLLRIKVVQVNFEPLFRLQYLFGGHIYRRVRQHPRRPFGEWIVNGQLAKAVIEQVFGFLSKKRQSQARKAIGRQDET